MNRIITVCITLVSLVGSRPVVAQRVAPVGATPAAQSPTQRVPQAGTEHGADVAPNKGRGVVGGVLGGGVGLVGGFFAGAAIAEGRRCSGEDCGLAAAILGAVVGESVGLAIGTHYGSGGRGNVALIALASTAIGVVGSIAGAYSGGALIVAVPVAQIAVALAMEH